MTSHGQSGNVQRGGACECLHPPSLASVNPVSAPGMVPADN